MSKIIESQCNCGEKFLIETDVGTGIRRKDGIRIFYPDDSSSDYCVFRCRNCKQEVGKTVPGAEYDDAKR